MKVIIEFYFVLSKKVEGKGVYNFIPVHPQDNNDLKKVLSKHQVQRAYMLIAVISLFKTVLYTICSQNYSCSSSVSLIFSNIRNKQFLAKCVFIFINYTFQVVSQVLKQKVCENKPYLNSVKYA